jgi:hypothetical protein
MPTLPPYINRSSLGSSSALCCPKWRGRPSVRLPQAANLQPRSRQEAVQVLVFGCATVGRAERLADHDLSAQALSWA